ncbi:MAG: ABC transporter permease [Verrucomicrobia bacterium]|nr:ABC transporter permease [Verrucomicrobiota bacterium]
MSLAEKTSHAGMAMEARAAQATVDTERSGSALLVKISGSWSLLREKPEWNKLVENREVTRIKVIQENLAEWDSALLLFLLHGQSWCAKHKVDFDIDALPEGLRRLVAQVAAASVAAPQKDETPVSFLTTTGLAAKKWGAGAGQVARFVGDSTLGLWHSLRWPQCFPWKDCLRQMQLCGAMALPIVGLISFLVGAIVAFQAALQLHQFGADIFIVNVVGLSVVREMGPMMAAIVVAGRTGAAYAAQLGNMRVGEEIDALQSLGISPIDFLVIPRLLALLVMMPLLALYADFLGILGGMAVASTVLRLSACGGLKIPGERRSNR